MLDFPNAPTINQVFTAGLASWKWDGVKWQAATAASISGGTPITVTGSIALPVGSIGDVSIGNLTTGPITITLPPSPTLGQFLKFKDSAGNAGTYAITLAPAAGTIDGNANYQLMSNFMSVELFWMGTQWGSR